MPASTPHARTCAKDGEIIEFLGDAPRVPLERIARHFNFELIRDGLASVSPSAQLARLTTGRSSATTS
jgi:hypothetical protein